MGTLFECLREARLEQYYPAFRANGINRSEMLSRLTLDDCMALGITSLDDKRRVIELINIIKSVHTANRSTPAAKPRSDTTVRRNLENRQHTASAVYQLQTSGSSRVLEVTRDVVVHDRMPNFSAASYMDMLQLLSESSDSASSDDSVHSGYQPTRSNINRSNMSAPPARVSHAAVERVKHDKGYNYGVPNATTKLKSNMSAAKPNSEDRIRVCVRKRPLTRKEIKGRDPDIVEADNATAVIVNEPKQAVDLTAFTLQHEFIFDEVFNETCTNEEVYLRAARPLISCLFNGANATCFAYGQTGAGKTHTMMGNEDVPGLYVLAAQDIFSIMESGQYGTGLCLWVSFFEIYCGQLFDLLNRRQRLHAREDGSHKVCIAGLMETKAKDVAGLIEVLDYGNSVRSKGATGVNPDSSRSHAILQMEIRDKSDRKLGRISFIDLAGSERAADVTDTDRQTRMEGAEINQSLLALKECIRSIDQESRHKPFRQSKLTHILKDSFIGNSRMCMIANISPTYISCENTLNTLRYADRVKELKRQGSTKNPSARQAMNLLMNIPITAPSLFHPSSIPSTSTPMRPQARSTTAARQHTFEDSLMEQSSPVRGHSVRRKTARSQTASHVSPPRTVTASKPKSTIISSIPAEISTPKRKVSVTTPIKSNILSAPATHISSPSGSDKTDSESCNLTLPKNAPEPVVQASTQSTDSEFDFPTSDFNAAEGLNDLNKSDPPRVSHQTSVTSTSVHDAVPASNQSDMLVTESSQAIQHDQIQIEPSQNDLHKNVFANQKEIAPALKKPKRSNSPARKLPSLHLVQTGAVEQPAESVPLQERPIPHQTPLTAATPLAGSVDDDMLFGAPPATKSAETGTVSTRAEERNHNNLSTIPTAMPASSSDLTQFTQRQRVVPPSDMEGILLTPRKADPSAEVGGLHHVIPQYASIYSSSFMSQAKQGSELQMSPKNIFSENLPMVNIVPDLPPDVALPSPVGEKHGTESKTPSPVPQSPSKDSRSQRQRHASTSSPADSSDDSFEAMRTSVSDSGQGPYKANSHQNRSALRKEKSDPILALHMQKKKHTLPDPHEFLRYLSRGATPKLGSSPSISSPMSGILTKNESLSEAVSQNKSEHFEPVAEEQTTERSTCMASGNVMSGVINEKNTMDSRGQQQMNTNSADISDKTQINYDLSTQSDSCGKLKSNSAISAITDTNRNQTDAHRFVRCPILTNISDKQSQVSNGSQLIQKDKPNIKLLGEKDATAATDSETSLKNLHSNVGSFVVRNNNSPFGGKSTNTAIVTEKLSTGSVFSPIHPQPLTSAVVSKTVTSSLNVIQPKPVHTTASLSLPDKQSRISQAVDDRSDHKSQLISAHEDQLATVTSLCKHEMKLLLGAKSGNRSFEDYLRRVNDLLSQKLSVMQQLQNQITSYCEERGIPAFSGSGGQSSSSRMSIGQSATRSSNADQLSSSSINISQSSLSQRAQR